MSEHINRCGCGGKLEVVAATVAEGEYAFSSTVQCECGMFGPDGFGATEDISKAEAIRVWNTAMRPRPRVRGGIKGNGSHWVFQVYIGTDMYPVTPKETLGTEAEAQAALREFCEENGFELEVE